MTKPADEKSKAQPAEPQEVDYAAAVEAVGSEILNEQEYTVYAMEAVAQGVKEYREGRLSGQQAEAVGQFVGRLTDLQDRGLRAMAEIRGTLNRTPIVQLPNGSASNGKTALVLKLNPGE